MLAPVNAKGAVVLGARGKGVFILHTDDMQLKAAVVQAVLAAAVQSEGGGGWCRPGRGISADAAGAVAAAAMMDKVVAGAAAAGVSGMAAAAAAAAVGAAAGEAAAAAHAAASAGSHPSDPIVKSIALLGQEIAGNTDHKHSEPATADAFLDPHSDSAVAKFMAAAARVGQAISKEDAKEFIVKYGSGKDLQEVVRSLHLHTKLPSNRHTSSVSTSAAAGTDASITCSIGSSTSTTTTSLNPRFFVDPADGATSSTGSTTHVPATAPVPPPPNSKPILTSVPSN
jgi:hypothetical protein